MDNIINNLDSSKIYLLHLGSRLRPRKYIVFHNEIYEIEKKKINLLDFKNENRFIPVLFYLIQRKLCNNPGLTFREIIDYTKGTKKHTKEKSAPPYIKNTRHLLKKHYGYEIIPIIRCDDKEKRFCFDGRAVEKDFEYFEKILEKYTDKDESSHFQSRLTKETNKKNVTHDQKKIKKGLVPPRRTLFFFILFLFSLIFYFHTKYSFLIREEPAKPIKTDNIKKDIKIDTYPSKFKTTNTNSSFIICAEQDYQKVKDIYDQLKLRGVEVALLNDNFSSDEWQTNLSNAIQTHKFMIICISNSVIQGDCKGFKDEKIEFAYNFFKSQTKDQKIIPIPLIMEKGTSLGDFSDYRKIDLIENRDEALDNLALSIGGHALSNEEKKKIEKDNHLDWLNDEADLYYYANEFEKTVLLLDTILMYKTDFPEILNRKAVTLSRLDKNLAALEIIEKAIKIKPDYLNLFNKGVILSNLDRYDDSIKALKHSLKLDKNYTNTLNTLGLVYSDKGEYKEAIKWYNMAIALREDPDFIYNKSIALEELGMTEKALDSLDQAIEINHRYYRAYYNKGCILSRMDKHQDAINAYNDVLKIKKDHIGALCNKGNELKKLDRFQEAYESCEQALKVKANSYEAFTCMGNILFESEKFEQSLEMYEKAVQSNPTDEVCWLNKGNALESLKRYDKALQSYQKAVEINPNFGNGWLGVGVVHNYMEDYTEAINAYDKAISQNNKAALLNKAKIFKKLNKYDEAIDIIHESLEYNPNDFEALYILATIYSIRKQSKFVLETCKKAVSIASNSYMSLSKIFCILEDIDEFNEALNISDKMIKLDKNNLLGYFHKGIILMKLNKEVEALDVFNSALKLNNPEALQDIRISEDYDIKLDCTTTNLIKLILYEKGNILYNLGKFKKSLESYNEAILIGGSFIPDLYARKGIVLGHLDKYKEAMSFFEKELEILPNSFEAIKNKGILLVFMHDYKEALTALDKAIKIKNDDAITWYNKGIAQANLGQDYEAIKSFNICINHDNLYVPAYKEKGILFGKLKRYDKALNIFSIAEKKDPENCEIKYYKGIALRDLEKYNSALIAYNQAIYCGYDNNNIWFDIGVGYAKLENYPEAKKYFDKAIHYNSTHSKAYYNRAVTYYYLNDYEKALSDLAISNKLEPNNPETILMFAKIDIQTSKNKAALQKIKEFLKIFPDYPEALSLKAEVFMRLAKYNKAIDVLKIVTKNQNQKYKDWFNLGKAYENLGEFDKALKIFQKALKFIDINNRDSALTNIGAIYYKLGLYDKANATYDDALKINPNNLRTISYKAIALYYLGRYKEALKYCDKALKIMPDDKNSLQIKKWCKNKS